MGSDMTNASEIMAHILRGEIEKELRWTGQEYEHYHIHSFGNM
jgi:hypothetical protein